jgi:hypothetical protein
MRRSLTEWLSLLAIGLFFATIAALAASFRADWPGEPLELASDLWFSDDVYVQIRGGRATLFNQLDTDSPGDPRPWIVDPRTIKASRVIGSHDFAVPGFVFQYYRFTTGRPVWSVGFSLAIPATLALIAAVLLIRRLRRGRPQDSLVRVETASPGTAAGSALHVN